MTGLLAASVYVRARRMARDALRQELTLRATSMASALKLDHDGLEWDVQVLSMPEYMEPGSGEYFLMYYPGGQVFGRSPSLGKQLLPSPPEWRDGALDYSEIDEGPDGFPCAVLTHSFRVRVENDEDEGGEPSWTPPPDEGLRFRMQVAASTVDRDAQLASLAIFLGLATAAALGAAAVCGFLVSRRLLRPLRKMTEEAETLVPEDTSRRLGPDTVVKELHRLATAFNRALDRQAEAVERQSRFTSDASHELRTPVSILLANSEYLLRRRRSPEEYVEGIERQRRTARRMSEVTENLLTLARADATGDGLVRKPITVASVLAPLCEEFTAVARERDIRITCEVEGGATVLADARSLGRLVTNLVSNALKFTPKGGEVRITAEVEGDRVILSCADTGPGIPPEHRAHIFDRFYRVQEGKDRREGAGLGLAIVAWVARAHGADLDVESEPGEGTTFRLSIPRHTESGQNCRNSPPAR